MTHLFLSVNKYRILTQKTPTCDFSVSPSPFGLDFGTLDLGLTKIETQWWEALQED